MSSNIGNQEAGQRAAEGNAQEQVQSRGVEGDDEVHVTDKRQITLDAESDPASEDSTSQEPAVEEAEKRSDSPSEIELLEAKLKESEEKRVEVERQVRDISERFRHAQTQLKAETEEQRARLQRVFDQRLEAARGDVIAGLLDTLDNLKRAIAAAEKSEKRGNDFDAMLEGVRATANMFESKMQGLGLTPLKSVGEEFNPEIHEAVEIVDVPAEQDNRVIDEFQTGYRFGDRLLRPARVRVGRTA